MACGVCKFDMKRNKIKWIKTFPYSYEPKCHTQFIDVINQQMIMFGGNSKFIGIFNLQNEKLYNARNHNKYDKLAISNIFPQSAYIPSLKQHYIYASNHLTN